MRYFQAKPYQTQVLDSVEAYFKACHVHGNASLAFSAVTQALWQVGSNYHPLAGFSIDMPYFCLRVPTGGGKTWLAAKCVALVNAQLLRSPTGHSVVLWLVPSNAIREQTLRSLKDMTHPYHAALKEAGAVTVMDLDEAKSVTRGTLDTSTVVIVTTRQAFQVENEECRKVYQSSGALMHHFDTLAPEQRAQLLTDGEGDTLTTPYSLANVLRNRRPFVIVDEAHNSRTELAFDMMAKLRPSGVLELTATPDTVRTPSNVLHSVSAAELKTQQMIKLPVVLQTEANWQQCLSDAIGRRDALHGLAIEEERAGAAYLRPIVLIQAEPRRAGVETLDVDRVRSELITNHHVPADEIVVATGDEKGLEAIDAAYKGGIADPKCPVKYVITQKALAEGWDCPFAYILVSLASMQSSTAVEQLLGRILRQPNAAHRQHAFLNQAYAYVRSSSFVETASALREQLVKGSGFERVEANEFVRAARVEQSRLDLEGHAGRVIVRPVTVQLTEKPDLKSVPKALRDKVVWDGARNALTINTPLTEAETQVLQTTVTAAPAMAAIAQAALESRTTAIEFFQTPAELGKVFKVPQLALRKQGDLELFDNTDLLDYPWDLSPYEAAPTADDLAALGAGLRIAAGGLLDIDDPTGKMITQFLPNLQRDLGLAYSPENWDSVRLAAWLCRNLPAADLTHDSKQMFVTRWVSELLLKPSYSLAKANLQKFLIRNLIDARIEHLRKSAVGKAYQQLMFEDGVSDRVAVSAATTFDFEPHAYSPTKDYDPRTSPYGYFDFRKHHYGRIGDFDSEEEFQCACWLDMAAQEGRITHWVRNLVRREACSFYLQKADGRFYPDFLCKLPSVNGADSVTLAVEYKGADRWDAAADDRLIGGVWADLSGGLAASS